MRRIFIPFFVLAGILIATISSAQISPQDSLKVTRKLFNASYPRSIAISYTDIDNLFKLKKADSFTLSSVDGFEIKGSVNNVLVNSNGLNSISLKPYLLPEDTRMVIMKGTADGKIEYRGFILNYNFPDAYKITSFENGVIIFSKMQRTEIVDE